MKDRPLDKSIISDCLTINTVDDMLGNNYGNMAIGRVVLVKNDTVSKNGYYIFRGGKVSNINNWFKIEEYDPLDDNDRLKILLINTIDAYRDECNMDSEEHFVEKLKEETGITIEEYNSLFEVDKEEE